MNKIRICVSAYLNGEKNRDKKLFCCLYSILSQTYENYEIVVHHDGPIDDRLVAEKIKNLSDKIILIETAERKNQWNCDIRYEAAMLEPFPDWVIYTNDDNYYVPHFLQIMLNRTLSEKAIMVYCNVVYGHEGGGWLLSTTPIPNYIDLGCFMTHISVIKETPWNLPELFDANGKYRQDCDGIYAKIVASKGTTTKANNFLFIHN
jgi:glycosyltransferase involved in cell wall biosynthesis